MKKRIILTVLILSLAVSCVFTSVAEASFGTGVAVMAEAKEVVKSALRGSKVVLSDVDFKQGLCITDFESVKIVTVPKSTEGTLMFAGRRVGEGTVIKRKNIGALVFIPATKDVGECRFTFTIDGVADGKELDFVIKFLEKVNYAPKADGVAEAAALTTQRDIALHGKMSGSDSEGDKLEYVIIKYPDVGSIRLSDKNSGDFLYTPPTSFVGETEFTYVVRDEYGNFSKPCTVPIKVSQRMCEVSYTDMRGDAGECAAVALTAIGAVDGRLIGDGTYFCPEDTVSKAEFLVMAMKCMGITPDKSLTSVYFDDKDEIASPMMPYVATAAKLGIINGEFDGERLNFHPNEAITKYDAAIIMSNLSDIEYENSVAVFADNETYPVWAEDAITEMCAAGIFEPTDNLIKADTVMTKRASVMALYKLMSLK